MKYRCTRFEASGDSLTLYGIDGTAIILAENVREGDSLSVEVKKWRKERTLGQNALWHKILGEIAHATGNDLDTVKEYIKESFGIKVEFKGMLINKPSHLYTTAEWERIMEPTIALAIEYGVNVKYLTQG